MVALESSWSATAHPNRPSALMAPFAATKGVSPKTLANAADCVARETRLAMVDSLRRREPRVVMPGTAMPGLRWC